MMGKYKMAGKNSAWTWKKLLRVPREVIWWALRRKRVMGREIMAIM